jgi:hypothetical protein
MYSISELNTINLRNQAVYNKIYVGSDGNKYVGTSNGRLRKLDDANLVQFNTSNTTTNTDNVQGAINNNTNLINQKKSDSFFEYKFTSAISFKILGTQYNFTRIPSINIYDNVGNKVFANQKINTTTNDISISFNRPQTGIVILT